MKFRKNKKGFTIVELIIVIAVIGILTAVMVPTIVHLVGKANKASDDALVSNLNKAIQLKRAEPGAKDPDTMHETVLGLKEYGYNLDTLVAKSDQDLLYDLKDNKFLLEENAVQEKKDSGDYWRIQKDAEIQTYNIYAARGFAFGSTKDLTVGFDAGYEELSSVSYKSTSGRTAVIKTNGGKLTVQAPDDVVKHYGVASDVEIKEVASSSYHLYGEVTVKLTVSDGRAVVENGGKVATLEVAKGAEEVVAEAGSVVDNLSIASDADIVSEKLEVKNGAEVNVVVNNSATVDTEALVEAGVSVVDTQSDVAQGKTIYNITKNKYYTGSTLSDDGDCILLADLSSTWLAQSTWAYNNSLDLNGHSISCNIEGRPVVNAVKSGRYLEIKGNGELIQLRTEDNSMVVLVENENVKIGEGVKMSGGAVGVWLNKESKACSVEIAGQYTTNIEHSFGIYRNGTYKNTEKCPTVTIKKTAKFVVPVGAAVYGAGYAVWNFEGGEFKSNECLEFKSGIITISGGRFETTASETSHVPNGNGTSANGYALAAIWNDGYAKPLTVTLDGGTFVGPVAKLNDSSDPSKIDSIVFNNNIGVPLA